MGPEFAPPPSGPTEGSGPYPPYRPEPPRPHRLMRSRRERMWAGVAGGLAEYFDLDPNLVRVLWVAATILSHGAGVAVYILLWVILPRDDRARDAEPRAWDVWSAEFHSETQRLADEARRMADDVRGVGHGWRAPGPPSGNVAHDPPTGTGTPVDYASQPTEPPWWATSERAVEGHRGHGRHPRSTGIALVTIGVVLLAANAGVFSWIDWRVTWPALFIGLGVLLLARQSRWGR
jgi:phage shock protein C